MKNMFKGCKILNLFKGEYKDVGVKINNSNEENHNYYVVECNNGQGTCKMREKAYIDWDGKCVYGKNRGMYCTANFELVEIFK